MSLVNVKSPSLLSSFSLDVNTALILHDLIALHRYLFEISLNVSLNSANSIIKNICHKKIRTCRL